MNGVDSEQDPEEDRSESELKRGGAKNLFSGLSLIGFLGGAISSTATTSTSAAAFHLHRLFHRRLFDLFVP